MLSKAGADENDLDDLASLAGKVEGSILSVTIRELPNGSSKISVRSNEAVDSIAICSKFGGGGHKMAAGCTIEDTPDNAEKQIMSVIDTLLV